MPISFTASKVAATDEDWGRLVLFGDIENMDGSPYLMFQGTYAYTEQDVQHGQDQPYVEIQNQGWSWYGHVTRLELSRDSLTLQMDEVASKQMENDGGVQVFFKLDDEAFSHLSSQLGAILGTAIEVQRSATQPVIPGLPLSARN
mgnify:CR=1 FL=1